MTIKSTIYLFAAIFLLAPGFNAQNLLRKLDFGSGKVAPGYTKVLASDLYDKSKGFGFEPGANMLCIDHAGKDVLRSDGCTSEKPFYFSAAVPEGNYKVTVTFGDEDSASSNVVKAEIRRLMVERVDTAAGKFVTRSFIVNVRYPQISTGGEVKLKDREKLGERWAWDDKLTLEFNGEHPAITAIEIEPVNVPTIYLLGDSTVCDQPGEPYASWGQMLTRFFNDKVAIANHAESGESLKSSYGAKRLEKVLSLMKKGDFLLIQYGHNDMKEKGEGIGPFTSYKASLKDFVHAAESKGASVVLINPMHRRTFDKDGKITNSHGDYPEAVRQTAKEENVPLIDLTAMSKDLYEALGKEGSSALFKEGDPTHHNNYGSYQLAKIIVQAIRDQKLPLEKFLIKDLQKYDAKKPDDLKTFAIPASPAVTNLKPLGS